jgi:hypothetical protein
MVASEATRLACRSSNSMASPHQRRNLRAWAIGQTSPEKCIDSGLDLEKYSRSPVEAELFFLTSLFIELIDS